MLKNERKRIADLGQKVFDTAIAPKLSSDSKGKLVALDVASQDYEITTDEGLMQAVERLKGRHPEAQLYVLRVGAPAVHSFGGALRSA
jgi:hypothetical protein